MSFPPSHSVLIIIFYFFSKNLLDFISKHAAVLRLYMHVPEASGKLVLKDSKRGRAANLPSHTDQTSELGGRGGGKGVV